MDMQLVALYEIKRQTFLNGFIQNQTNYSPALAYAYYHRLAPFFHEDDIRETYKSDPFESVYAVKREFIEEVVKYLDERDLAKDLSTVGFYDLERKFGGYKNNRIELIHTLRYARIDGRFNADVWDAVEHDAPTEANSITSTFVPKDVYFG